MKYVGPFLVGYFALGMILVWFVPNPGVWAVAGGILCAWMWKNWTAWREYERE